MKKRLLAILMTLCMIITLLPVTALAAGDIVEMSINGGAAKRYAASEVEGFFSDLQAATTADVKMLSSFAIGERHIPIKEGQTVSLDFNGCTLSKADNSTYAPIENYGTMTLLDTSEAKNGGIAGENRCVNNYGTMTIDGGKYSTSNTLGGTAIQNKAETAIMTINDCVVTAGVFAFYNAGTATINGGKFENYGSCSSCNPNGWAYTAKSVGTLYVNGGEIHGVQGALGISAGYAEIRGGTFYAHACELHGHQGEGSNNAFYGLYVAGEEDEVKCVVYDGNIISEGKYAAALIGNDNTNGDGGINADATSEIKGGTFTATLASTPALKGAPNTGNPIITGGTFSSDVSEYVADTASIGKDSNSGKWVVSSLTAETGVAETGGNYYSTLAAAVAAAGEGETVTLLKDVTMSDMLITRKTMTLDLGGKTLTATGASYAVAAVAGTLTVQNGTIDVTSDEGTALYAQKATIVVSDGAFIRAKNNAVQVGNCIEGEPGVYWGNVIVNDGASISGDAGVLVSGPYPVSALQADGTLLDTQSNRSTLTVNGGTISGEAYAVTGNGTYHGTTITITGGTIKQTGNVGGGALYHPQNGTLNISGDPVLEGESGIQLCSGEGVIANITGGTVRATGLDGRADKTGDGFIPDGAALSVVNRNYPGGAPKMNVSGGYFSAQNNNAVLAYTWSANAASDWAEAKQYLSITGGYFTSDPSAYTEDGLTGVDSGRSDYPYTVGVKGGEVVPVAPSASDVQAPAVSYEEGSAEKTLLDSAQTALASDTLSAEGTGLQAAAKTQANNNSTTVTDEIVGRLDGVVAGTVTTANTHIVVQPYTEMTITGVDATAGQQSITLEIQPMYRTVATTVDLETTPDEDIIVDSKDGTVNAVVVGEPKPLTVSGPVEITIPLPDGFTTDGAGLVVKHEKNGTLVGYHRTTYNSVNKTITFTNDKGFSSFTVLADTRSATVQFKDKDGNNIGSAETYGPADVNEALPATAAPSGQVFNGWTFEDGSGNAIEGASGAYTTLTDELLTALNGKGTVTATPSFYTPSSGGSTTYAITVEKAEHGTVTSSHRNASRGVTVTLTVKADEGYELDGLSVTDANGSELKLTDKGNGKYTFTMPGAKVTVKAAFKAAEHVCPAEKFPDVDTGAWYHEAVDYVLEKGMMQGSGSRFMPADSLSRGMLVQVLYNLEGKPAVSASAFEDVPAQAWYADAVAWASANQVVGGYGNGKFGPEDSITREQMAAILYRYAKMKGYDTTQGGMAVREFADYEQISDWAGEAMAWAVNAKVLSGKGNHTLDPKGTASRAEVAQVLMNFGENVSK